MTKKKSSVIIPEDTELLNVYQTAALLNCGATHFNKSIRYTERFKRLVKEVYPNHFSREGLNKYLGK